MFYPQDGITVWLDYIAIWEEYKGMGYGGSLFQALCRRFGDASLGMLFSVEYICEQDAALQGARPIELLMDDLLAGEKPETDRILACIDIRNRYNV